jgi:tetratricopeptide (TPR) repeat protein
MISWSKFRPKRRPVRLAAKKYISNKARLIQAAADIEKAIAANPGQVRYYLLLSEIYNSNGFGDKALKALQQAEKIDPIAMAWCTWRLLIFTGIKKIMKQVLKNLPWPLPYPK